MKCATHHRGGDVQQRRFGARAGVLFLARAALACALAGAAAAHAQTAAPMPSARGELLYSTHCIQCHTTEMHWREGRQARDWETLKAQVRRWQSNANLGWSESDITEVARHLNETIYRFPQPEARRGPPADRTVGKAG